MQTIKEDEQYLEIRFYEARILKTERFGEMEIGNFLIHLSGKFASNEQLTFFNGKDDYSNAPLIKSTGLDKLKELLEH